MEERNLDQPTKSWGKAKIHLKYEYWMFGDKSNCFEWARKTPFVSSSLCYNFLQNIFGIYYVSLQILIWSESLTLPLGYSWQDNYKI